MTSAMRYACDYCGLPLPGARRRAGGEDAAGEQRAEYCCVGCRIAAQVTAERGEEGAVRWTLAKLGLSIFFTMNVLVFSMALWSEDFYSVDADRTGTALADVFRYLSLLFALPVLLLLGEPLLRTMHDAWKRGAYSTDALLLSGIAAAYVYSAVSVLRGNGHIYFEVGCVVLVLVTLGRWMEATGRLRASSALAELERLLPPTARLHSEESEREVPLSAVVAGHRLRVREGERIPVDGLILRGTSSVDEQVLTGESWPVLRQAGDSVYGGTLNLDGGLEIRATVPGGEGVFRRLIDAVRRARETKGQYERLAERASSLFFPAVIAIAVAAFAVHTWNSGWERGILSGLAVVLIACPCALGIATPMAIWSALGRAAQEQVLFQSSDALELLSEVRRIYFDKTGTLTTGAPALVEFFVANPEHRLEALFKASRAAAASTHPLSRAILDFARSAARGEPAARAQSLNTMGMPVQSACVYPGQGVVIAIDGDGTSIYLGSRRFLAGAGLHMNGLFEARYENAVENGHPVVLVGWNGCVRGLFSFDEQLRREAPTAIRECRKIGLEPVVLTGDHNRRAHEVAAALELPVEAELLPEQKMQHVRAARKQSGLVAMVGDGINDAPALASSDVGIALGCGADVSRESADVCLLGNDLTRIPWSVRLSRHTVRVIRMNLVWAFAYNIVGVILAAFGWLNPALAALVMVVSSVLVTANSLRLGEFERVESGPHRDDIPRSTTPKLDDAVAKEPAVLERRIETSALKEIAMVESIIPASAEALSFAPERQP